MRRLAAPVLLLAALAVFAGIRRILSGSKTLGGAIIHTPTDDTGIDADGAVRSVQGADIIVPTETVQGLWDPEHLERLARTYWKSLTRFTFGLIRVRYTETERYVTLLHPRIRLLTFNAPEYEMDEHRGVVKWRIQKGFLVAPDGREGDGYLELDVCRFVYEDWGKTRIHVEVEVANFYPAIASRISRWVYANTQSRIHVIACHVFLRSLVKRQLDVSKVGHFAGPQSAADAPNPTPSERGPIRGDQMAAAGR
jgi:hypothetical protein